MLTKLHVRIEFLPHRKHNARPFKNNLKLHKEVIAVYFKLNSWHSEIVFGSEQHSDLLTAMVGGAYK